MGRPNKTPRWDPARLRKLRAKAGLTQVALAQRAGMGQSKISAYETGGMEPKASEVLRLAAALNVPAGKLLGP